MTRIVFLAGLAALAFGSMASQATADITFFTSRTDFESGFSAFQNEDFEEANIGLFAAMANPLNSSTENSIFSAGDITSGFEIESLAGGVSNDALAVLQGVGGGGKAVFGNTAGGDIQSTSTNKLLKGMGADILRASRDANTITLTVFGSGDTVLGSTEIDFSGGLSAFVGATSDSAEIERIAVTQSANDFVGFDRVTHAVPEASPVWLLLAFGVGLVGYRWTRRAKPTKSVA